MMNSFDQQKQLVLDEVDYYFYENEKLKEDLREIKGIPNATYLIKDKQVFVFEKLVRLVSEQRQYNSTQTLAELACSLITDATVSAEEAVETWGIMPTPYEITKISSNMFTIHHRPFNARLPDIYQNKREAQKVLAKLLLGDIQESESGDFTYRDQKLTLCDPLDTALLPQRPVIQDVEELKNWDDSTFYPRLCRVTHESGFKPVSKALFDDVMKRETIWKKEGAKAAQYTKKHVADLWMQKAELRLDILNNPTDETTEYGQEDFAELRPFYPELSMFSDGALCTWFGMYQRDCWHVNGWTPYRDDGFLFYLLGKVADCQCGQDANKRSRAMEIGQWVAYALLRGDSLNAALVFGQAADLYDSAISNLAGRILNAMLFLAEDKKATKLHGPAIITRSDLASEGLVFANTKKNNADTDAEPLTGKSMSL